MVIFFLFEHLKFSLTHSRKAERVRPERFQKQVGKSVIEKYARGKICKMGPLEILGQ